MIVKKRKKNHAPAKNESDISSASKYTLVMLGLAIHFYLIRVPTISLRANTLFLNTSVRAFPHTREEEIIQEGEKKAG